VHSIRDENNNAKGETEDGKLLVIMQARQASAELLVNIAAPKKDEYRGET
jgi:hypothetical protein